MSTHSGEGNKGNESYEQTKARIAAQIRRKLKRANRSHLAALQRLQECLEWDKMHHEALLLQANLFQLHKGMKEAILLDWQQDNRECHIALNPLVEPKEQALQRFRKSKKLKKGIPYCQAHVEKVREEIAHLTHLLDALALTDSYQALAPFSALLPPSIPQKSAEPPAVALPYRKFLSTTGFEIWVGKGAKDNDLLTFQHARGSDWWLHVRDYPGSHVVIRVDQQQEPDSETLQEAMQLALYYSKARDEKGAEICLTQCKHVQRVGKGKSGSVHLAKQRILTVKADATRLVLQIKSFYC
jgi:predicted ribosome quality control (RQC) complex YloA/Tae2 family protein